MACERELFLGGEDANADAVAAVLLGILGREDEGSLREACFAGNVLHLIVGETACIVEYGKRIAFEGALGEDIEDGVSEGERHEWQCSGGHPRLTLPGGGDRLNFTARSETAPSRRTAPGAVQIA